MQVATAAEMQSLDRTTIETLLIPGMVLMENAGRGTFARMEQRYGPVRGLVVPIYVGPGNNGGDGLVIARAVHEAGGTPLLFFLVQPDRLKGDAQANWEICARIGLAWQVLDEELDSQGLYEVILERIGRGSVHSQVDAIFGIGLVREMEGIFRHTVQAINQLRINQHWPTVAVDLPSGLDTDTGTAFGVAIQADLTVTYGLPKPAHFLNGPGSVGALSVVPIGIPPDLVEQASLTGGLIDHRVEALIQPKPKTAHKGSNGHLLVLAGSEGKTGAALLCAQGALYSGVGLVTMAVPERLNPVFEASLAEAMTVPLPGSQRFLSDSDYPLILEMLQGKDACVIGPGLGTSKETGNLVQRLYREISQPLIVDADALNLLARTPTIFAQPGGPRILTPHPGEMARLTGASIKEIQQHRIQAACWQSGTDCTHALITVLKGAGTIVADATGRWSINTTGNPAMATGGMGDVLAGVIASLVAQGYSPWRAASLGVYLHGKAADHISIDRPVGILASEVAIELSRVIGTIIRHNEEELQC